MHKLSKPILTAAPYTVTDPELGCHHSHTVYSVFAQHYEAFYIECPKGCSNNERHAMITWREVPTQLADDK